MYGKNQWKGREVEGRYSDLMTFFVRELDFTNKNSYGLDIKNLNEYPHYYFTIEFMKKSLKEEHYLETLRWILDNSNSAVTIEANEETLTAIKPDLFNRCHIIYRISDPYLEMLKATDTLSIDAGWYRVHQVTKCNMMEISPDNYKFDEEI
jgi:hypothetical protein|tara:strand:+ start:34 stop:486 length:453 start_codon:yes stop_codon:yes gene_type:complete